MLIDSLYKINMPRTVSVGEGRENTSTDTGFGGPGLGQWLRAVHRFVCLCGGLGYIYIWTCIRRLQIFQHHTTWESYILLGATAQFLYIYLEFDLIRTYLHPQSASVATTLFFPMTTSMLSCSWLLPTTHDNVNWQCHVCSLDLRSRESVVFLAGMNLEVRVGWSADVERCVLGGQR